MTAPPDTPYDRLARRLLRAINSPRRDASDLADPLAPGVVEPSAVQTGSGVRNEWLTDLERQLGHGVELDRVLNAIVDETARQLGADRGTLYLVDHATRELVSRAAHLPEIAEIRLRHGEGISGWVASHGQPLRIGTDDEDPRWAQRIDAATGYRTRNMVVVPIRDGSRSIVGVLQLLNKRDGDFSEADLRRLTDLSQPIARMLDATSLGVQLRPDHRQPLAFRFNHIVGDSAMMQAVYARVERAAVTDATVLIRGETGTGKELIARAVHFNSPRSRGPFTKVDCAALPAQLIENELFGHERGAFTGADQAAPGKIAAADGGTLFLDEIGELPLPVQGKLLRLLQERVYLRVGGSTPQYAQVRFVCATHADLEQAVQRGDFRKDLYYRVRVVEITMPPLRLRGHGDIDRLVDHFLYEFSRRHQRPGLTLSPAARAALHAHLWPGNVRELEHCVEAAVVLAPGSEITPDCLPLATGMGAEGPAEGPDVFRHGLAPLAEVERAYIEHVLARCAGNRSAAARLLDIGRNTLARRLGGPAEPD